MTEPQPEREAKPRISLKRTCHECGAQAPSKERVCPECGAWFLDPRPTEDDFPVIYPANYAAYEMSDDAGNAQGLAFRAKAILERGKIKRYAEQIAGLEGDVLDVGCGILFRHIEFPAQPGRDDAHCGGKQQLLDHAYFSQLFWNTKATAA